MNTVSSSPRSAPASNHASAPRFNWLPSRKLVATVFALLAFVALCCAALYLSAVLFLVLNKADPRQARFNSITHYWVWYADDVVLRKKLVASIAISAVGLLVVLPGALFAASRHGVRCMAMRGLQALLKWHAPV